jgi:hypothetical protein
MVAHLASTLIQVERGDARLENRPLRGKAARCLHVYSLLGDLRLRLKVEGKGRLRQVGGKSGISVDGRAARLRDHRLACTRRNEVRAANTAVLLEATQVGVGVVGDLLSDILRQLKRFRPRLPRSRSSTAPSTSATVGYSLNDVTRVSVVPTWMIVRGPRTRSGRSGTVDPAARDSSYLE